MLLKMDSPYPLCTEQIAFLEIAASLVAVFVFVGLGSLASALWRPQRPNAIKCSAYESGEAPVGNAWGRANTRLYTLGLVFLLFEVETVLLFPWAVVHSHPVLVQATDTWWVHYTTWLGTAFVLTLIVGLVYVGSQGYLTWPNAKRPQSTFASVVPDVYYDKINSP